jgi:hypothetical protein
MAGELSQVGANNALDGALGRATQTARTVYLALLSAAPSDTSTLASMTEITTSGYSRQSITWAAPSGDPSSTSNSNLITFGPFSADPPNVTHCACVSAASGTTGDFIAHWALTAAKDAANGESISFAIGALVMTLD